MKEILNKTKLTFLSVFILLFFLLSLSGCAGQAFRILNEPRDCTEETLSSDCDGDTHVRTFRNTKCEILSETVSSCYRCLMTSEGPDCIADEEEWNARIAASTATFSCSENYGGDFVCAARDQLSAFEAANCESDEVLVAHCSHNCAVDWPVSDSPRSPSGGAVLDTTASDDLTPTGYAVSRKGLLASKGLISKDEVRKELIVDEKAAHPTDSTSTVEYSCSGDNLLTIRDSGASEGLELCPYGCVNYIDRARCRSAPQIIEGVDSVCCASCEPPCKDSDSSDGSSNSKNFFTTGTVRLVAGGVFPDSCSGDVLSERFCNDDGTDGVVRQSCKTLGKVCSAGACVSP